MGNQSQSMPEWSGSIRFGNADRKVDFFYKPWYDSFHINGTIVNVVEMVKNEIVLVVNKVIWYGLRLIIFDRRGCGNKGGKGDDFLTLELTSQWGISKESVETHIENLKHYFQSAKYVCY